MGNDLPLRIESKQMVFDEGWVDTPIKHFRSATTFVGDFFEEQGSMMLEGSERIRTMAGHVCPDIYWDGRFVECKAMRNDSGKNGHTILFTHRIDAYEEFIAPRNETLWYLFWIYHHTKSSEYRLKSHLFDALARCQKTSFFIPAVEVHALARDLKKEKDSRFPEHKSEFVRVKYQTLKDLVRSRNGDVFRSSQPPVEVYGRMSNGPRLFTVKGK